MLVRVVVSLSWAKAVVADADIGGRREMMVLLEEYRDLL